MDIERFHSRIGYGECICIHRIIRDLDFRSYERCTDLVLYTAKAYAGALVHFAGLMVQECPADKSRIKEFERPAVTVELLAGSNPLGWNRMLLTDIIFAYAVVRFVVVVLFDEELPPVARFFEGLYLLSFALGEIAVDQSVVDLYLAFVM